MTQARRGRPPRLSPSGAAATDAAQLLAGSQPLYVTVATALAAEILDGRRPIGALLPTEQELCQAFSVSRSTIRQALRRLGELGLVAGAQGVGTRVIADQPRGRYVLAARSVTDVMGYADPVRLDIASRQAVTADDALAARIGCEPGADMVHVQGMRRPAEGRGSPISICELWIAGAFMDVAMSEELAATPAYRLIARRRGIAVEAVEQEMGAIALDAAQAEALQVKPGTPGLLIRRRFLGAGGTLIEATSNVHASAEHFVYALRLGAPEAG